ncbi:uncharacterized protein LOC132918537 [Rhopalosiphum padi]|uniref:uncharacterized protein LOC132918537 n=1 Tax=Rhopalosiphum padi TaxID=40932 RepID=UPI00298E0C8B|nr:uncharacterized protein LOC132918537 [Rhopalosiphum padi]
MAKCAYARDANCEGAQNSPLKTNIMEEWHSISSSSTIKSTNSKNSIDMYPSRDEIDSSLSENLQLQLNSLAVKIQDIENKLLKDRKDDIKEKSKDSNPITNTHQIPPRCTELYQSLQNTVKELENQKFMFNTQLKGLSMNLNNNNIRLVSVENDVKNIIVKHMDLSQMYKSLQDQLEMVSGKINVKFDHLEQLSHNTATTDEYYGTNDS